MTEDEVITAARSARQQADLARDRYLAEVGRACANLHTRGWTWSRIGQEMGVNLTTAFRWARPYLPADTE